MNIKQILVLFVALVTCLTMSAQVNVPKMNIEGKDYYYYQVGDKESVHGIAQKTGLSPETIVEYNTNASSGLVKGQLILVPVKTTNKQAVTEIKGDAAGRTVIYTLEKGDDIYTVARKFNCSIEALLKANIKIDPNNYVEGTKVKVTPNSSMPINYNSTVTKFGTHIIGNNESFYSIANTYGTTPEVLHRLNPAVDKLKKGKPLTIPTKATVHMIGTVSTISIEDLRNNYAHSIDALYSQCVQEMKSKECNVAIVLPFQFKNPDAPKQAKLYVNFLNGIKIALDSLSATASRKINLKVYDTRHNLNVTDSILALPEMTSYDLVIAPGEPQQLERINAFGQANNISILNCFSTKNDNYKTNPNVLLVNTPTPNMVANLTNWFKTRFVDCTVIFLQDANETELCAHVKRSFEQAGINTVNLKVDGDFNADAVSRILDPGSNYVFIASNGSKALLNKVMPALKTVKDERIDCDINFLAYPEHVLYLKEHQDNFMTVDTYMFSRFFNSKGHRTHNIEASYAKRFSGQILESYPNMAIFGYDTGELIIKSLGQCINLDDATELHKGVQTGFKFAHKDGCEGLINQAITLVHFSTDKKIESFVATGK